MNNLNKTIQKGFTLIEIMIALTIGIFLTAGATQIFIGTKNTNRMQENLSRMQENARFAMYFLTNDIRQAGYEGTVCGGEKALKTAYNNLDSSAAEYQIGLSLSLSEAIKGDDSFGINGEDKITVRRLSALGEGLPIHGPFSPLSLFVDQASAADAGFKQGDIFLVTDCINSDIFQVVNNPLTSGTLTHSLAGGGTTPGNITNNLKTDYAASARVYRLSGNAGLLASEYDVSTSTPAAGSVIGLRQGGEQLVPDIEDMQILYGQASGATTYFVPAGTAGLEMEKVMSVRVSLLVRSQDDFVATSKQPYFFNGVSVSGAAIPDNRLRKVYTSTIAVRNRLN